MGLLLPYPRRERAKPLEGRAAVAHVVCGVFCVLYVVFACMIILANQLVNIDLDKEQISKLCAAVNIKQRQKHTDIFRCARVE